MLAVVATEIRLQRWAPWRVGVGYQELLQRRQARLGPLSLHLLDGHQQRSVLRFPRRLLADPRQVLVKQRDPANRGSQALLALGAANDRYTPQQNCKYRKHLPEAA